MNKKKTIIFLIFAFIFLTSIYIISKKKEAYTSSNLFDYIYKDYKEYSDLDGNYGIFNKEFLADLDNLKNEITKAKYLKEFSKEEVLIKDINHYLSIDYNKVKTEGYDVYFEQIDMMNNVYLNTKKIVEDGVIDDKENEYINVSLEYISRLKEGIEKVQKEIENNYSKLKKDIKTKTLYDFSYEFNKKEPIIKYLETKKIIEDLKDNKDFILIYEKYKSNKQKDEDDKQDINIKSQFYNKDDFDLNSKKKEVKAIITEVSNKLNLDYKAKDIEFIEDNRFSCGNFAKDDIVFDIDMDNKNIIIRILKNRNLDEEDIIKLGYKKINKEIPDYKYMILDKDNHKKYKKFNDYYYDYNNFIDIELDSNNNIKRMNIKNVYKFLEDKNTKDYKKIIEKDKFIIRKNIKNIKTITPLVNRDEFVYNLYFEDDYSIDVEVKEEKVNIINIYLYKKY